MWAEFANVEASGYLSVVEEKALEKNALMQDVIASIGIETTSHARFQMRRPSTSTQPITSPQVMMAMTMSHKYCVYRK